MREREGAGWRVQRAALPCYHPLVPGRRDGMATRSQKRRVDVRVFPSFRGAAPAASVRRAATASPRLPSRRLTLLYYVARVAASLA